jgi:hypothetical protein
VVREEVREFTHRSGLSIWHVLRRSMHALDPGVRDSRARVGISHKHLSESASAMGIDFGLVVEKRTMDVWVNFHSDTTVTASTVRLTSSALTSRSEAGNEVGTAYIVVQDKNR